MIGLNAIPYDLDKLQYGPTERFIVYRPLPFGLGGQISGRINSLILALALDRKAVFLNETDPPYHQTFSPLCSSDSKSWVTGNEELVNPALEQEAKGVEFDPLKFSFSEPGNIRTIFHRLKLRYNEGNLTIFEVKGAVFNWMRLTPDMYSYCEYFRTRLEVDDDTLGVHYRRGDKLNETAYVPASEYNRSIAEIVKRAGYSKLFVASDSPRAVDDIDVPPGVRLIYDVDERRFNNANHTMLIRKPELAADETRVAFKNIWLLSKCGGVVGQDNAHFAEIAASSINARIGEKGNISLIDGRIAERRSPYLRMFYSFKFRIRKTLKFLLPHLTTKARYEKRSKKPNYE